MTNSTSDFFEILVLNQQWKFQPEGCDKTTLCCYDIEKNCMRFACKGDNWFNVKIPINATLLMMIIVIVARKNIYLYQVDLHNHF